MCSPHTHGIKVFCCAASVQTLAQRWDGDEHEDGQTSWLWKLLMPCRPPFMAISPAPRTSAQSDSTASNLSICTRRVRRSGMLYPAVLTLSKSWRPSLIPPISSRFSPKLSARCLQVFTTAASLL